MDVVRRCVEAILTVAILPVLMALGLTQCVRGDELPRAFSRDWADDATREAAPKADPKGIPLMASNNPNGPRVKLDEKGKPRLTIGKDMGVSADVKIGDNTGVRLKFKRTFDMPVPKD